MGLPRGLGAAPDQRAWAQGTFLQDYISSMRMLSVLSGNLEDEGFFLQDYVYDKICSSDSLFWAACKQGCAAIAALHACPLTWGSFVC